jgi:hypothetical protein
LSGPSPAQSNKEQAAIGSACEKFILATSS